MGGSEQALHQGLYAGLVIRLSAVGDSIAGRVEEDEVGRTLHAVVVPHVPGVGPQQGEGHPGVGYVVLSVLEGAQATYSYDVEPVGVVPSELLEGRAFGPARLSQRGPEPEQQRFIARGYRTQVDGGARVNVEHVVVEQVICRGEGDGRRFFDHRDGGCCRWRRHG